LWLEEELRTEYADVEARNVVPTTASKYRPNVVNNMDGWDMYDLWVLIPLESASSNPGLSGYWLLLFSRISLWLYHPKRNICAGGVWLQDWYCLS
jgi:hypothetical protein